MKHKKEYIRGVNKLNEQKFNPELREQKKFYWDEYGIVINDYMDHQTFPPTITIAQQINVSALKKRRDDYQEKYKIKIFINGESEQGLRYKEETACKITSIILQFERFPIASYIQHHFDDVSKENDDFLISSYNKFYKEFEKIRKIIPPAFIEVESSTLKIRKNLNENELIELEKTCKQLDNQCIEKILSNCKKYIPVLEEDKITGYRVSRREAEQEVLAIQNKLKETNNDSIIGYLYTNKTVRDEKHHFESILISKEQIIKPIDFLVSSNKRLDIKSNDYVMAWHPNEIYPQADKTSCGVFNLVYLKELLKDNAKQLKEHTKTLDLINIVDNQPSLNRIFLPSPQVLKYSQSSFYNLCVKEYLSTKEDEVELTKNSGKKVKFPSMEGLLKKSINAYQNNPKLHTDKKFCDVYENNIKLLEELDQFRNSWLAEYKNQMACRDKMTAENSKNYYASYKSTLFSTKQVNNSNEEHRLTINLEKTV